jgi:hypothetical protein
MANTIQLKRALPLFKLAKDEGFSVRTTDGKDIVTAGELVLEGKQNPSYCGSRICLFYKGKPLSKKGDVSFHFDSMSFMESEQLLKRLLKAFPKEAEAKKAKSATPKKGKE